MTAKTRRRDMTPEEAEEERRRNQYTAYLRSQGKGGIVDAADTQKRIRRLVHSGVPLGVIADRTGVDAVTLRWHKNGFRDTDGATLTTCRWKTRQAVLGARFTDDDIRWPPAAGTRRRIRALVAAGYPAALQASIVGLDYRQFHYFLLRESGTVNHRFAINVRNMYDKYADLDPVREGAATGRSATYARTIAGKRGYAPPSCWDDDTIDDPDAFPEWTGACGTESGYQIHYREHIVPSCQPCRDAHSAYRQANPDAQSMPPQYDEAVWEYADRGLIAADIAEKLDLHIRTVTRAMKRRTE